MIPSHARNCLIQDIQVLKVKAKRLISNLYINDEPANEALKKQGGSFPVDHAHG
jgi:hypothetical protein